MYNIFCGHAICFIIWLWFAMGCISTQTYMSAIPFFFHHFVILGVGVSFKSVDFGNNIWIYSFTYAEIPTCILNISWFIRNIANNLESFEKYCMHAYINHTDTLDKQNKNSDVSKQLRNNWQILNYIDTMKRVETKFLLVFAGSFLYARAWVHTRVLVPGMHCGYYSPTYNIYAKIICIATGASLCIINFFWCYKIVLKAKRDLYDKPINKQGKKQ